MKPIIVAHQFKFMPFDHFSNLLDTLESWIFSQEQQKDLDRWYASGEPWSEKKTEPSAVSVQHGVLCSASLCQNILHKLQAMV